MYIVPELAHTPSCEPQLNADRQPVGFSGLSGFSAPPLNGNYRRLMVANPRCPSFGTHSSYGLRESTGSQAASPAAMHTVLVVAALEGLPRKQSSITCVRRTPAVQIAIDCNQGAAVSFGRALHGAACRVPSRPKIPKTPNTRTSAAADQSLLRNRTSISQMNASTK